MKVPSKANLVGSCCVAVLALAACSLRGRETVGSSGQAIVPVSPTWEGWESLSGGLVTAPVIVAPDDYRLAVFATGPDGTVWERVWAVLEWVPENGNWRSLGNKGNTVGAPAAVASGNVIELFARDSVTGHLLHQEAISHDGGGYPIWNTAGWEDLGGNLGPGKPTVVLSQPGNQAHVFVTNSDVTAATIAVSGYGSHGSWVSLSGADVQFEPGAASWGPDRLDVFVTAGDALYHRYSGDNGATWYPANGNWEGLGGSVAATPAVTSWGPNRLDVVVSSVDASINHLAWTGGAWGTCGAPPCWSSIPGVVWSDPVNGFAPPTTVTTGTGNLELFVQGTDRGLYTYSMSGTDAQGNPTWAASQGLAGCFSSAGAASAVSPDGDTLDVVVAAFSPSGDPSVWHAETLGGLTPGGLSTSQAPPACPCGGTGQPCCDNNSCGGGDSAACLANPADVQAPWTCELVGSPGQTCRPCTPSAHPQGCPPPCAPWAFCNSKDVCQACGGLGQVPCGGNHCLNGYVSTPNATFTEDTCEAPCGTQSNGPCCSHVLSGEEYPTCSGNMTCNEFGYGGALQDGRCVSCGTAGELCCNAWTSVAYGTCTDGSSCDHSTEKCVASSGGSCQGNFSPYVGSWTSEVPIPADAPFTVSLQVGNVGCIAKTVAVSGIVESFSGVVTTTNVQDLYFGAYPALETVNMTFSLPAGAYAIGLVVQGYGTFYYTQGLCVADDPSCGD